MPAGAYSFLTRPSWVRYIKKQCSYTHKTKKLPGGEVLEINKKEYE
jgi:hypothetical protein